MTISGVADAASPLSYAMLNWILIIDNNSGQFWIMLMLHRSISDSGTAVTGTGNAFCDKANSVPRGISAVSHNAHVASAPWRQFLCCISTVGERSDTKDIALSETL